MLLMAVRYVFILGLKSAMSSGVHVPAGERAAWVPCLVLRQSTLTEVEIALEMANDANFTSDASKLVGRIPCSNRKETFTPDGDVSVLEASCSATVDLLRDVECGDLVARFEMAAPTASRRSGVGGCPNDWTVPPLVWTLWRVASKGRLDLLHLINDVGETVAVKRCEVRRIVRQINAEKKRGGVLAGVMNIIEANASRFSSISGAFNIPLTLNGFGLGHIEHEGTTTLDSFCRR